MVQKTQSGIEAICQAAAPERRALILIELLNIPALAPHEDRAAIPSVFSIRLQVTDHHFCLGER